MHNSPNRKAAIILARLDSNRFPAKAVTKIGGKRLIEWSMDSLLGLAGIQPILATTDRPVDTPLVDIAVAKGIPVYRGSLDNVAERVAGCIREYEVEYFARVNGDSPFMAPAYLLEAFDLLGRESADFVTNLIPRAFPYGISIEVMRSQCFLDHLPQLNTQRYQEHITSYFYDHIDRLAVRKINYPAGNDHHIRLVVDTPADKDQIERLLVEIPGGQIPNFEELVRIHKKIANT